MQIPEDLLVIRALGVYHSSIPLFLFPVSTECQSSRMNKQRQSSAAAFPLSWVANDDPLRKVSFEYPPDRPMYQKQVASQDSDPIRTAHVDTHKEDYQELDEYASVVLEYGELPDPDHCE